MMFTMTSVRLAPTWSLHTARKRTVSDFYKTLVAKRVIQYDPDQWAMAEACTPLLHRICKSCATWSGADARSSSAHDAMAHACARADSARVASADATVECTSVYRKDVLRGFAANSSRACLRLTKMVYGWCAEAVQSREQWNHGRVWPRFGSFRGRDCGAQTPGESPHPNSDELTADNAYTRAETMTQDKVRRGLYLYGDVGTGKTMILDLFNMCEMPCPARRAHLHSFMTDLSDRLVRAERTLSQHRAPSRSRSSSSSPSLWWVLSGRRRCWCTGGGASHRREHGRWARWLASPSVHGAPICPMDLVVHEILAESPVLCFDEFQTFDVAHAALLSAFFTRALRQGLFLLSTSNRSPEDLCLVSPSLASFIPVLRQHCHVLRCTSTRDYRRQLDSGAAEALVVTTHDDSAPRDHRATNNAAWCHRYVFMHPSSKATVLALMQRVERGMQLRDDAHSRNASRQDDDIGKDDERMTGRASQADVVSCDAPHHALRYKWATTTLRHHGRCMYVPRCCGGVALFDFCDLCGDRQRLASSDFQLLAQNFHSVVVVNVPRMLSINLNAAHQFVVLVDELYQHNVKLLMTLQVPWYEIMDMSAASSSNARQGESYEAKRTWGDEGTSDTDDDAYYSEGNDERSGYASKSSKFRNDEEIVSFRRIHSRLCEMGSRAYLLRDHTCFVAADYNFSALVEDDACDTATYTQDDVTGSCIPDKFVCS